MHRSGDRSRMGGLRHRRSPPAQDDAGTSFHRTTTRDRMAVRPPPRGRTPLRTRRSGGRSGCRGRRRGRLGRSRTGSAVPPARASRRSGGPSHSTPRARSPRVPRTSLPPLTGRAAPRPERAHRTRPRSTGRRIPCLRRPPARRTRSSRCTAGRARRVPGTRRHTPGPRTGDPGRVCCASGPGMPRQPPDRTRGAARPRNRRPSACRSLGGRSAARTSCGPGRGGMRPPSHRTRRVPPLRRRRARQAQGPGRCIP
jgi:hypothetical protein